MKGTDQRDIFLYLSFNQHLTGPLSQFINNFQNLFYNSSRSLILKMEKAYSPNHPIVTPPKNDSGSHQTRTQHHKIQIASAQLYKRLEEPSNRNCLPYRYKLHQLHAINDSGSHQTGTVCHEDTKHQHHAINDSGSQQTGTARHTETNCISHML
jgi:hypothetical protein